MTSLALTIVLYVYADQIRAVETYETMEQCEAAGEHILANFYVNDYLCLQVDPPQTQRTRNRGK